MSWRGVGLQLVSVAIVAGSWYQLGIGWTALVLALTLALVAGNTVRERRRRVTVGPTGITVSWGFGRGRSYPWPEIRWIAARDWQVQGAPARGVRITLADGRRRTMPLLHHSTMYPNPDFETEYLRVVRWWHASTEPTARFQLPEKPKRLSPVALGRLLTVIIVAVVVGVTALTTFSH